jgi:hypothetical protein
MARRQARAPLNPTQTCTEVDTMKLTRSQLDALMEALENLTIDPKLSVKISEVPNGSGELLVRISDHWGYEYVRINRQGLATRPDLDAEFDAAVGEGRR